MACLSKKVGMSSDLRLELINDGAGGFHCGIDCLFLSWERPADSV